MDFTFVNPACSTNKVIRNTENITDIAVEQLAIINYEDISNLKLDVSNINNNIGITDVSVNILELSVNTLELSVNTLDGSVNNLYDLISNISGGVGVGVGGGGGDTEIVNDVSQTFYEIMTQQPYKFDSSGIPVETTTSTITFTWNYDNILATHNNDAIYAKLAYLNDKTKNLPFINSIKIDISGVADGSVTGWLNYQEIVIPDVVDYNTSSYKQFVLTKFTGTPSTDLQKMTSSSVPFDLRIYGVNYSENYPDENARGRIYYNVGFPIAEPPSMPNFISETINSKSQITLVHDVSYTENGVGSSNAVLTEYIIDFSENETLASVIYSVVGSDLSDNDVLNNIDKETNFNVVLNGLRSGTKYNYTLGVKNDLNDNSFSLYSDSRISEYTFLPNSGGIGYTLNFASSGTYTNVTTSNTTTNLNNASINYINLAGSETFALNNTNNQSIEITKPYFGGQQNTTVGYGRWTDSSAGLVEIYVAVNDVSRQLISFDCSFGGTDGNMAHFNSNTFEFMSLGSESGSSLLDIYTGNSQNRGFRMKGIVELNSIPNNQVQSVIGDPSANPYVLTYDYGRHVDVGGSGSVVNHNIYIDDISINPAISNISNQVNILTVAYCMGIPSVQTFDISFQREYANINSQYMYIRGDRKIADVRSIGGTSCGSTKNILLLQNEIVVGGVYNFDDTELDVKTGNYYNSINYTVSILANNNVLNWNERVYNLYVSNSGVNNAVSFTSNHYCDYNSFNLVGNKINDSNLDLVNMHIYELSGTSLSLLGSNLGGLGLTHYTDHSVQINDHSILFIDGKFQSNGAQAYPVMLDYSYNGVVISNDFSGGLVSYGLDGVFTGNNSGYKYIAIKLLKSSSNPESYIFNSVTYDRVFFDGAYYLSLKSILQNVFESSVVSALFDIADNDAIGFCRASLQSNSAIRIGNFKQSFNAVGGNWQVNGGLATSYTNSMNLNYGCKIENDNGDKGIYISPTALNDDLTIFIGLKNL